MNVFDGFEVAGTLLVALGTLPVAVIMARAALTALIAALGNHQPTAAGPAT
jgi:hypothetical protein